MVADRFTVSEALAWLGDGRTCLTFAGAGLSIPAPACAPSVAVVRDATLKVLTDVASVPAPDIDAARGRLLPEALYGSVAAVLGTARHLRAWSAYSWMAAPSIAGPYPNAGHHLLAWLALAHRLPAVTTNFDCYLEQALQQHGLWPAVGLPGRGNRFDASSPAAEGEVAVWKLHGSANRIDTIKSQAADLAHSSFHALARDLPYRPDKLLIVGYSGRDFDVFPWLAELASRAECLWVDTSFHSEHRALTLKHCHLYEGSFEDLARPLWTTPRPDPAWASWQPVVMGAISYPQDQSDLVAARYKELVRRATVDALVPLIAGDPDRARLSLALAISTAADFPATRKLLSSASPDSELSVRTDLLRFFALESMDRHNDAERHARTASRQARLNRDVLGFGWAEMSAAYARIRRFVSTIADPGVPPANLAATKRLTAALRFVLGIALLFPLFLVTVTAMRRRSEGGRHYEMLEFTSEYVEQLIRAVAIVSAMAERLPARVTRPAFLLAWRFLSRLSATTGYLRGTLNVRKYLARLSDLSSSGEAVLAAAIIGDSMAGAIASRDSALALLRRHDDLAAADRDAVREEARRQLMHSVDLAKLAGNPSIAVKDLLLMRRYDMPLPVTSAEVATLVGAMQGEVDNALATAIIARLTEPDTR